MDEDQQMILAITARLLSYPNEMFADDLDEITVAAEEVIEGNHAKKSVLEATDELRSYSLKDLQEIYVQIFDYKEKTGLYLTAHEYGDNRKRGAALIKLQKMISDAGFERADGELSDYMPMLFELLAQADDASLYGKLNRRLACVAASVSRNMEENHPYQPVMSLLDLVFETPTDEEIEKLGEAKEDPDLNTMPYPLLYQ